MVRFSDSPLIAFTDPPLTTVRQPMRAMATSALGALLEAVAGTPVQRTQHVFPPKLVGRGSTSAPPTRSL
ncbi:substrate-binding domain-containing protein [Streptomyces sp. NPDC024017]|uniref:substrate-binding domain-containing protein n=1 Tax=Streptomyces sp. NPDC024017 TaxID=3154326 RepID=UPI0033E0BE76